MINYDDGSFEVTMDSGAINLKKYIQLRKQNKLPFSREEIYYLFYRISLIMKEILNNNLFY